MIRTSQPGWNEGAITLSASRSRLRTLFRTTAPPSLRPVDMPKRVSSRSVRRTRTTSRDRDLTVPSPCSAAKSSGLESITSRGELWPRSVVRPSASCDRERGGRPKPGDPRWSSSGRGNRVLCAMPLLGLKGLLHRKVCFSPFGLGSGYPERHANAPGARKRFGASAGGLYVRVTTSVKRRRP